MKHKFTISALTISSIFFASCVSELEKKAYDTLHPTLLNPNSYDLISIEKTGDINYFENIERARKFHEEGLRETLNAIDSMMKESKGYEDDYMYIETLDLMFRGMGVDSAMIAFLERESNAKLSDFPVGTEYAYRFHAENEHGEIAPHLYYMYTDNNDSIYYAGPEKYKPIIFDEIPQYQDTLDYWIFKFSE
ncbi:MAG: hypothetical protein MJZ19_07025 [Paludibacteraceae bacterium]|nr:hypothetical protein [Paludibacteraceae bacterium]